MVLLGPKTMKISPISKKNLIWCFLNKNEKEMFQSVYLKGREEIYLI